MAESAEKFTEMAGLQLDKSHDEHSVAWYLNHPIFITEMR